MFSMHNTLALGKHQDEGLWELQSKNIWEPHRQSPLLIAACQLLGAKFSWWREHSVACPWVCVKTKTH